MRGATHTSAKEEKERKEAGPQDDKWIEYPLLSSPVLLNPHLEEGAPGLNCFEWGLPIN